MKDIKSYILEGRTIEEVSIKDANTNEKVNVAYYCYDKESLDKVAKQYQSVGKHWKDKGFFLATLKNKSTWVVNMDEEYRMNTWQPNGEYISCEETEYQYTYNELIELLDEGNTMLVVINK